MATCDIIMNYWYYRKKKQNFITNSWIELIITKPKTTVKFYIKTINKLHRKPSSKSVQLTSPSSRNLTITKLKHHHLKKKHPSHKNRIKNHTPHNQNQSKRKKTHRNHEPLKSDRHRQYIVLISPRTSHMKNGAGWNDLEAQPMHRTGLRPAGGRGRSAGPL